MYHFMSGRGQSSLVPSPGEVWPGYEARDSLKQLDPRLQVRVRLLGIRQRSGGVCSDL